MVLFWSESEFCGPYRGSCGPNAMAMGASWAYQSYQGTSAEPATVRMVRRMQAANRCDANGVTNGGKITAQFLADGFAVDRQASGSNFAAWLAARLARPNVAVVELSNGQALRDSISGQSEDASNLQYHFILACFYHTGGYSPHFGVSLPAGFACSDGDNNANNPIVGGVRTRRIADHRLQFYPTSVLAAARPVDLIAIAPRVALGGPTSNGGGNSMAGVPSGWSDDGTTLKAPNGVPVVFGFRNAVLHAGEAGAEIPVPWEAMNYPLAAEYASASIEPGNPSIGGGSRQDFRLGSLGYTTTRGVYRIWIGQDVLALGAVARQAQQSIAQTAALQAKLDKVKADVA